MVSGNKTGKANLRIGMLLTVFAVSFAFAGMRPMTLVVMLDGVRSDVLYIRGDSHCGIYRSQTDYVVSLHDFAPFMIYSLYVEI